MSSIRKIVLAAGGTGGHIWPAISFGRWITKHHPECETTYFCGSRPLELEIYHAAGIKPVILNLEGSPLAGSGLLQKARRCGSLLSACSEATSSLRKLKPDKALLFGGYLSFPMLLGCKRLKISCAMHEQNARAGKVTRFAASFGVRIYTGWKECKPLAEKKFLRTGVPVRSFSLPDSSKASSSLGIKEELKGPKVVVFTGSLGSASIKAAIESVASMEEFRGWSFIMPAVSEKPQHPRENLWLLPRVWETENIYGAADILVLRCGGSTLTEAEVLGIPSVAVPWKRAADNHQYYNALSFVSEARAVIYNEDEGPEKLASILSELGANLKKNEIPCGAEIICENLWSALCCAN